MSTNAATKPIRDISPNGNRADFPLHKNAQESVWSKAKRILPHREDLVMPDGRQIKGGIVIHPIIATALLGVVVTIGLSVRSEINWQHDELVKITTQKEDAEKMATQEHNDRALQASTDSAWRERMRTDMNRLADSVAQIQKQKEKN